MNKYFINNRYSVSVRGTKKMAKTNKELRPCSKHLYVLSEDESKVRLWRCKNCGKILEANK
jgi:ABC-type ATPase with predicted acetyltransferase domain